MSIDLEFNSALGNQTYFYQKCGSCTQKSNETWNLKIRVKTKKKHLWLKGYRWKMVGPKSLYIQDLRTHGSSKGQSRFAFWSFNFWPRSYFYPKNAQKVQKVILFFIWKGEEISLDFTIFGKPNGWIFPSKIIIISFNLAIYFREKKGAKVGPKV